VMHGDPNSGRMIRQSLRHMLDSMKPGE
jgi:hypothetical protein